MSSGAKPIGERNVNDQRPDWMLSEAEKAELLTLRSIPYHDRNEVQRSRLAVLEKKYDDEGAILDAIH